jgi:hypothetical protein
MLTGGQQLAYASRHCSSLSRSVTFNMRNCAQTPSCMLVPAIVCSATLCDCTVRFEGKQRAQAPGVDGAADNMIRLQ